VRVLVLAQLFIYARGWLIIDVCSSCVCPVTDHEFCHNIVKVAVDLRGDKGRFFKVKIAQLFRGAEFKVNSSPSNLKNLCGENCSPNSLPSPPLICWELYSFVCYFTTYSSIVIGINKLNWCFCQSYNKWIVQASLFFLNFVVHLADVRHCFQHL